MKSQKTKTVKHIGNFWIDLLPEVRFPILDKAVENGYLKKEFVEEIKELEIKGDRKYAITK